MTILLLLIISIKGRESSLTNEFYVLSGFLKYFFIV